MLETRHRADATARVSGVVAGLASLPGRRHVLEGDVCLLDPGPHSLICLMLHADVNCADGVVHT